MGQLAGKSISNCQVLILVPAEARSASCIRHFMAPAMRHRSGSMKLAVRSRRWASPKAHCMQPSVYYHAIREVMLVVHVDDFLAAGTQESLDWVHSEMSRTYDLKRSVVSSSPTDEHEVSYLNRDSVGHIIG